MAAGTTQSPKVAIVHDWLVGGGAERVIQSLHELYPDAPIYTSYCTPEWRKRLDNKVVTGFLQHWPFGQLRKLVGPLRMWWFSHLDLSAYDVVIVSSGNGEAIGVRPLASAAHILYCHAPTHYFWRHYEQYSKNPGVGALNPLVRLGLRLFIRPLRSWNFRAAQRADIVLANSMHTQAEIAFFYKRQSTVVHPPVDIDRFAHQPAVKRSGFVTAGRQTPYKRTDLIVEACTRLNLPLVVIGRGPEHERLVRMAGPTVQFPENITDEQMSTYLASAEAFLFAAYEDFGITPVEALAAGTPVIAYRDGGALDYVVEGKTGSFFGQQTAESLMETLKNFDSQAFDHLTISQQAAQFAPEVFSQKMQEIVENNLPR
jgi:glycosyltransferase involved in cell wall biosynthesis